MITFRKINQGLLKSKQALSHEEQVKILRKFEKKPSSSAVERSYCQYMCQKHIFKINRIELLFLFMYPVLVLLPIMIWLKGVFTKKTEIELENKKIVSFLPSTNLLPKQFDKESVATHLIDFPIVSSFSWKDVRYCYSIIFKSLWAPYFFTKNILVISQYSGIAKVNFDIILVSNEYSFTSSVLTDYLRKHKKFVINCMHGEKAFNIRDAFVTYDKFIVWDKFYSNLFEKLHSKTTWEIDHCDALLIPLQKEGEKKSKKIVYFLQGNESKSDLLTIRECLIKLRDTHKKSIIKVKEHPRYKTKFLTEIFDPDEVVNDSLENLLPDSIVVASNYSTVLFQVYITKKNDDLKLPYIAINDLMSLPSGYIMKDKTDFIFSQL